MLNNAAVHLLLRMRIIDAYPLGTETLAMLSENGAHLVNRRRVNFLSNAEMGAPVALNDRQQAGHLSKLDPSANRFIGTSSI